MKYCLNEGGEFDSLTIKERNSLILYCLSVGTRAVCSTNGLLRPLKMRDLNAAFEEQRKKQLAQIEKYERLAREYDPENPKLEDWMYVFFGRAPTKERLAAYCNGAIKNCKMILRGMKRDYYVCVNYRFVGKKLLDFHRSLNPRVTFGYSTMLHEECDFALDDNTREAFLNCSLSKPSAEGGWDWGYVVFGEHSEIVYEDLSVYRGVERMLETVSHEKMMTVWLDDGDLAKIADFDGGKELVLKLSQK